MPLDYSFKKQLRALVKLCKTTKTPYAVLGGLAVCLYGEPRSTMDVDVNVSLPLKNIGRFISAAKKIGFSTIHPSPIAFAKKTGIIQIALKKLSPGGRCDIIIAQNPIEQAAINRAKLKKFSSLDIKFITAEDLILHKITANRPKDIADLKGIIMRQGKKLDTSYILFWLNKIDAANKTFLVSLFKSLLSGAR